MDKLTVFCFLFLHYWSQVTPELFGKICCEDIQETRDCFTGYNPVNSSRVIGFKTEKHEVNRSTGH